MGEAGTSTLKSLPVQTNPAYAVKVSLERLHAIILKTERVLKPSWWRKMLGGTSRDHARSVVAVTREESRIVRGVFSEARAAAFASGTSKALIGSIDRAIKALDSWSEAAIDFEEAIYGSDEKLIHRTRKLVILCGDLKNPASGIAP